MTGANATTVRHLRPRGDGAAQPTTSVELFFDLVFVFAVTQLSHLVLDDLTVAGAARAAFLLLVVWWAWIYTTWMTNWFDPGRVARDAYTYAHLPIVAGIIATAVAANLLITAPHDAANGAGVAMILGGPALYLLGESAFARRTTGVTSTKRVAVAALLILLVPLGGQVSVLVLSLVVASLLPALAVWELRGASAERTTSLAPTY